MRKGDLLRAIYAELRSSLGRDVAAGEVVRLANLILRSYTGLDDLHEDGRVGHGQSLVCSAVDTAMRDGGWRVMEFEESQRSYDYNDDGYLDDAEASSLIGTLLGPEWKHPSLAHLP